MPAEQLTEKQIVRKFQEKQQELSSIAERINGFNADIREHNAVIEALQPMDKSRKCYRQIGGVLVERNVGEVLPAVTLNRDNIEKLVKELSAELNKKKQELLEFQKQYKIRIKGEDDEEEQRPAAASGSQAGVLVS